MNSVATQTFREAVCEEFECPAEGYEAWVLLRCLHPQSRPLAELIWHLAPGYFRADFEIIRQIGLVGSTVEMNWELKQLFYEYRITRGFLRRVFRVRLSRRCLLQLGAEIFH